MYPYTHANRITMKNLPLALSTAVKLSTLSRKLTPRKIVNIFIALLLLNSPHAIAGQTSPQVRLEIDGLFKSLHSSQCQFNRNGSWYNSTEAQAHLTKKLEHFDSKGMIHRTEDFIKLAASTSSTSGKPYQVKCGSDAVVDSHSWLSNQLKTLRASK